MPTKFLKVLRGYDPVEVDRLLARADQAQSSEDESLRTSTREALRSATFTVRLRGYDRIQVDQAVQQALNELS